MTSSSVRPVLAATSSIDCDDVQEVLAAELALRIRQRVAGVLDAKPPAHNPALVAEQRVDLGAPSRRRRRLRASQRSAHGPGLHRRTAAQSEIGVFRREERAVRRRQVARHVVERVLGDRGVEGLAARLRSHRDTRARAAPGRRASSRSAARATRRRPSSDGSRRRCDRACRRSPSRAACRAPSAARASPVSACALQQEQQLRRPRKLRRAAEPAVPRIERLRERRRRRRRARPRPATGARSAPVSSAPVVCAQPLDDRRPPTRGAVRARPATRARSPPARR